MANPDKTPRRQAFELAEAQRITGVPTDFTPAAASEIVRAADQVPRKLLRQVAARTLERADPKHIETIFPGPKSFAALIAERTRLQKGKTRGIQK